MTDLRVQLQATLGDRYTLTQELAPGNLAAAVCRACSWLTRRFRAEQSEVTDR